MSGVFPCTGVGGWGPCMVGFLMGGLGQGFLYGEVQCIMGNGHMGPPPCDRMADRHN